MFVFFDLKIKVALGVTLVLAICTVVSFILAWTAPAATDVNLAVNQYLHYRWFAFLLVSTFSVGTGTFKYHQKQLSRL